MPKRKLAMSDEGGPGAKSARKVETSDNDDIVKRTNDLSTEAFRERYVPKDQLIYRPQSPGETHQQGTPLNPDTSTPGDFRIALNSAQELKANELSMCFALIEQTSRPDYEASSWGWHPKRKLREMRDAEMWYLLVSRSSSTGDTVEGFLSFMITHDSHPPVPVLYIYEIHLVESLRKIGLGAHLMQLAEEIARRVGLCKVMLTCFLSNMKARCFYEKRAYTRDVCSPDDRQTRKRVVEVDYVIMSQAVEDALP